MVALRFEFIAGFAFYPSPPPVLPYLGLGSQENKAYDQG